MRNRLHIVILLALSLTACNYFSGHRDENVVAEIGPNRLYRSELEAITSTAMDSADAKQLADAYIRQWATDILFYEKARAAADPQVEAMVDNYRRSLYLHRYEQQLVDRRMSKVVPQDSIRAYYDANIDYYRLHEDILKGVLIILPQGAPHPDKVRKWLQDPTDNIEHIEKYAYQNASGYQLFTDTWTSSNQVMMRMPFEQSNLSQRMRNSDFIEMEDSIGMYMLYITDKRFVGDPMPIEYATPMIQSVILQKREVEFLRRQREALYENALGRKLKIHEYEED